MKHFFLNTQRVKRLILLIENNDYLMYRPNNIKVL